MLEDCYELMGLVGLVDLRVGGWLHDMRHVCVCCGHDADLSS